MVRRRASLHQYISSFPIHSDRLTTLFVMIWQDRHRWHNLHRHLGPIVVVNRLVKLNWGWWVSCICMFVRFTTRQEYEDSHCNTLYTTSSNNCHDLCGELSFDCNISLPKSWPIDFSWVRLRCSFWKSSYRTIPDLCILLTRQSTSRMLREPENM